MNGGLTPENSSKRPLENVCIPKYKPRKVSAYRDFPPGCGRNAAQMDSRTQEKSIDVGAAEAGDLKNVHIMVANGGTNGVKTVQMSQFRVPLTKDKYRKRRVSAIRDFPPLCGRNASQSRVTSVNDDVDIKMEATKITVLEEMITRTTSPKEKCLNGVDLITKSSQNECFDGSTEMLKDGIGKVPSVTGNVNLGAPMDGGVGDLRDDEDTRGSVVKEIAAYSNDRSGDVDMEIEVVQGLMAAPYCPWRQKKKKVISWQNKYKSVARKTRVKADCSSRKKMVHDQEELDHLSDIVLCLPAAYGPSSLEQDDARNRMRETLHLFHANCRKLFQEEEEEEAKLETKQLAISPIRIDLRAAKMIREKTKEVNTGKQYLGQVPGVKVGDEFQYRVELAIAGIHRSYQSGIDSMKHNGLTVATSIVASGGYNVDVVDMENADVLIYSVSGQDEMGNLALRNSLLTKTPVRVIRGWKETRSCHSPNSRFKIVSRYIYDGLYTVEKYWTKTGNSDNLVFVFELRRNPGQPELARKESNKYKARSVVVCIDDISGGKEAFPIRAVNTVDSEKPRPFNYITEMMHPDWFSPIPPQGCNCTGRCSDSKECLCALKNGGEIPFNENGAIVEAKPLVYECGPCCKCPPSCYNRVSQRGIKFKLEIFKTESRGWGVRCPSFIPSGSFICEYAGELLEDKEAEQRIGNDEYLFDIGQNYNVNRVEFWEEDGFTIDAAEYGNVGRFINHSCSPNLYAQNVIYDHDDKRTPHVMLFAAEDIPPLQELTYHYNYSLDQVLDSNGNIKIKRCYCGTAECCGRMY